MYKLPTYLLILLACLFVVPDSFSQQVQPTQKKEKSRKSKTQEPEDYQLSQLAAQYYRERQYDKAAELYEQLYDKNPTQVYYMYLLYSLVQIGDFKRAEKLVKKQVRQNPDRPKYLVDMGYVYISSEESHKAKKYYEQALNSLKPSLVATLRFQLKSIAAHRKKLLMRRHPVVRLRLQTANWNSFSRSSGQPGCSSH